MKQLLGTIGASLLLATCAMAQDVIVRPYVFADDASSNFSYNWSNGCLTLQDLSVDGNPFSRENPWANRHHWFVTMDGISPAIFDPNADGSSLEVSFTLNLAPAMQDNRTVEGGLYVVEKPFPRIPGTGQETWFADGVLMIANENAGGNGGEIAAFGGRMPFWGGAGARYMGGPAKVTFRYNGATMKVQYEVEYNGNTYTSPELNPGDGQGLRFFSIGGFVQINRINDADPNRQAVVSWCDIKVNGRTIVGRSAGDVNLDGCVDDSDLLLILFNFGAGCNN